ncbi:MAG: sensor histidine kinase [Pseudomonadota bacterium]
MKPSPTIRVLTLAGLVVVSIGILHIAHLVDQPDATLDEYRIETMRIVESHSPTPPVDAEWLDIDADTVIGAPIRRDNFNSSWLAIDVPAGDYDPQYLALYLRVAKANVAVYLGSRFVNSSGEMQRPLPFYLRPLYIRLPISANQSQPIETVYVRLAREGGYITPNEVFIGPADVLATAWRSERLYGLWLPAAVATLMLALATSLLVLYFASQRRFTYYGIYGVIIILWALHSIHTLVDRIPMHHWTWFTFSYLLLWWVILTPAFANRFFDLGMKTLERSVIGIGVLLTIPILVLLPKHDIGSLYTYFALVWVPFILLCLVIVLGQYAYASWRQWSFESVGLFFVCALGLVIGVRDYLFDWTTWVPGTTYYTKYASVVQIAYINVLIAKRYARSARDLVMLNRTLEGRVQEKARELEEGYEERRILERERTLSQERDRLMRDMHDGLGGQLIQALAMSEKSNADEDLRESLERALIDLRLIVDSIAPSNDDLTTLLASFRHRSKRVWEKSGARLHWDMGDLPTTSLSPEQSLNLLRILQESSTNALRHGHAGNIYVTTRNTEGHVRIEIRDDGSGFDPASAKAGFGLVNMRRRAEEAGMELAIDSGSAGTRITIDLPAFPDDVEDGAGIH